MAGVTIDGVVIPIEDFPKAASAVTTILSGAMLGRSPGQVLAEIEPTMLPVIEGIANTLFPGAGTALEVIAFILANSKPMTDADRQRWWDRASGQGDV